MGTYRRHRWPPEAFTLVLHRRVNVTLGPREDRQFITGLHTVADIQCTSCHTVLGWKYVSLAEWEGCVAEAGSGGWGPA